MPNHSITNATTSILDMSPLHDAHGRVLTLKPGESREVDDVTFHDDIVQRMLKPLWLTAGKAAAPVALSPAPPTPPATPEPTPEPAPLPAPPAPSAPLPEPPVASEPLPEQPVAPSEPAGLPVETPTSSETPMRFSETISPKNKKK
jgi:hypothetical protein